MSRLILGALLGGLDLGVKPYSSDHRISRKLVVFSEGLRVFV